MTPVVLVTTAVLTIAAIPDRQRRQSRDPFVSVLVPAPATGGAEAPRIAGLPGLAAADAFVSGLLTCGSDALAILAGPDGVMYVVRQNDRLRDAVIEAIDAAGVLFRVTTRSAQGVATTHHVRKRPGPADGGGR